MSEKDNGANMPEGRRVSKSSSSRETLYLKREQLLREMQTTEDIKPVTVREQVEALKNPKSAAPEEDDWGAKEKRRKGAPWMLWLLIGLAIPVFLVALMLVTNGGRTDGGNSGGETGLDFDVLSGAASQVEPEDWFVKNSAKSFNCGVEVLDALSEPDLGMQTLLPLVRNEVQAELLQELQRAGKWAGFDTSQPTELRWEYGSSGDLGFMSMVGMRKDFRDFRAYFVRENEQTLLDVAATGGLSDIPILELEGEVLTRPTLLRCWLAKEPHFDARSDQSFYSWYQVLAPNEVDFVWAFARVGSEVDESLREALNYGKLIGERQEQIRAAIRVSNARGFRPDEFVIDEVLALEWVLPAGEESD